MTQMHELAARLQQAVGRVLLGKPEAIELAVTTLLAGGHLLIEDHPGVGKTLLARSLARALDLPFQRIQCTADLLPSDVIGAQVYDPRTGEVRFRPGPVFTSVLLADELNRMPPRTQSALLECMAEHKVTVDRETHDLPEPFFVVATQNPTTSAGTYLLPDNQLDRFLMRIRIGHPDADHEARALGLDEGHRRAHEVQKVATREELLQAMRAVDAVKVSDELAQWIVALANRTRRATDVALGVSTRGAQALHRAARARAMVHGRDYVVPDDVLALVAPTWAHRIVLRNAGSNAAAGAAEAVLAEIVAGAATPD
jgi:MoxR-like ATPase